VKYKKFEDAVSSPDGLCVLTVFIEVIQLSLATFGSFQITIASISLH